jgi:hypothetical protein
MSIFSGKIWNIKYKDPQASDLGGFNKFHHEGTNGKHGESKREMFSATAIQADLPCVPCKACVSNPGRFCSSGIAAIVYCEHQGRGAWWASKTAGQREHGRFTAPFH